MKPVLKMPLVRASVACLVALACLSLSACNTMAGLGKDMESLGSAIEKSADKAKK